MTDNAVHALEFHLNVVCANWFYGMEILTLLKIDVAHHGFVLYIYVLNLANDSRWYVYNIDLAY